MVGLGLASGTNIEKDCKEGGRVGGWRTEIGVEAGWIGVREVVEVGWNKEGLVEVVEWG